MDEFEKELKLGFLEEAEQCLNDVEQSFLTLETDPHNEEHINKIFRLAHNLKGSSKAVGFEQFGQFTHQFESFVLRIKNSELVATASVISLLLKTVDFITVMIDSYKVDLEAKFEFNDLLAEIQNFQEPDPNIVEIVAPEYLAEEPTLDSTFVPGSVSKGAVHQHSPRHE